MTLDLSLSESSRGKEVAFVTTHEQANPVWVERRVRNDESSFQLLRGTFGAFEETGEPLVPQTFLHPFSTGKIIGIGANFPGEEAPSLTEPSFFVKASTSLVSHLAPIELPPVFKSVAVEAELAAVVGKRMKNVPPNQVRSHLVGFMAFNDLSGRDTSLSYVPPSLKKSCDTFGPCGPSVLLDPELMDVELEAYIDGKLAQKGNTRDLRFSVEVAMSYLSSVMSLMPGDLVALGAPVPKPFATAGQTIEIRVGRIMPLINPVI